MLALQRSLCLGSLFSLLFVFLLLFQLDSYEEQQRTSNTKSRSLAMDMSLNCTTKVSQAGTFDVCPFQWASIRTTNICPKSMLGRDNPFFLRHLKFSDQSVGLALQMSLNRLPRLLQVLERWKGPISAAIFLRGDVELQQFHEWLSAHSMNNTQLQLHLDIHLVLSAQTNSSDYPINFLRNVALDYGSTRWIFICDVDAIPSHDSEKHAEDLGAAITYQRATNKNLHKKFPLFSSFIIPSLEFTPGRSTPEKRQEMLSYTKSQVTHDMKVNALRPMHPSFKPAYYPTNYFRWMRTNLSFEVPYTHQFEPYFMTYLDAHFPPRFDESFTNFGKNKAQQAFEMAFANYNFIVLPDLWIFDTPNVGVRRPYETNRIKELYSIFLSKMEKKYNKTTEPYKRIEESVLDWISGSKKKK